jgi:hypothetical protein
VSIDGHGAESEPLETGLFTLSPTACGHERFLFLCAAVSLGTAWGRAPLLAQPRTSFAFFASIAARSGLALDVVPEVLSVDASIELEVPLTPVSFETAGRSLWTSSWLAGALRVGVSLTAP